MLKSAFIRYLLISAFTLAATALSIPKRHGSVDCLTTSKSKRGFISNLCRCIEGPRSSAQSDNIDENVQFSQNSLNQEEAEVDKMYTNLGVLIEDVTDLERSLRKKNAFERLTPKEKQTRLETAIADWNSCKARYSELLDGASIKVFSRYQRQKFTTALNILEDVCVSSKMLILSHVNEYHVDLLSVSKENISDYGLNFDMKESSKQFLENEVYSYYVKVEDTSQSHVMDMEGDQMRSESTWNSATRIATATTTIPNSEDHTLNLGTKNIDHLGTEAETSFVSFEVQAYDK